MSTCWGKEPSLMACAATNLSFLYFLEAEHANAEKYADIAVKADRYNARALVNKGNCNSPSNWIADLLWGRDKGSKRSESHDRSWQTACEGVSIAGFFQHNHVPLCFCMLIVSIIPIFWYGHVLTYDYAWSRSALQLHMFYQRTAVCFWLFGHTHTAWNQSLETCRFPPWMTSYSRYVYERWVRKGQRGIPRGYWCECRLLRSNLQPWLGEHAYRQLVCKENNLCFLWSLGQKTDTNGLEGEPCHCDRQVSGGLAGLWQAAFYHPCELRLGDFHWGSFTDVQLH